MRITILSDSREFVEEITSQFKCIILNPNELENTTFKTLSSMKVPDNPVHYDIWSQCMLTYLMDEVKEGITVFDFNFSNKNLLYLLLGVSIRYNDSFGIEFHNNDPEELDLLKIRKIKNSGAEIEGYDFIKELDGPIVYEANSMTIYDYFTIGYNLGYKVMIHGEVDPIFTIFKNHEN